MQQQDKKPVAAGKSSYDLVEPQRLWDAVQPWNYPMIIDAGCGVGNYTVALSQKAPAARILACDLWREGVFELGRSLAEEDIDSINPVVADLRGMLPVAESVADGVLMATVLHDLVKVGGWKSSLEEVRRVLRPGGRFWVVEFLPEPTPKGPPMEIRLAPEKVAQMTAPLGFRPLPPVRLGDYLYLSTLVVQG